MDDRKKDEVFTDPMMELELVDGTKISYPKYLGMKRDSVIQFQIEELFNFIKTELGDNAKEFNELNVYQVKEFILKDPDKWLVKIQGIVALIVSKDAEWVDKNLYLEEMIGAFSLFLSVMLKRNKRMFEKRNEVFRILGIDTSTPLLAQEAKAVSDGQLKKPTELQKKKSLPS